jgi:hypothetical protein
VCNALPLHFFAARSAWSAEQSRAEQSRAEQSFLSGKKQRETARWPGGESSPQARPSPSLSLSPCLILACALSVQLPANPCSLRYIYCFIVSRIIRHPEHDCPPAPQYLIPITISSRTWKLLPETPTSTLDTPAVVLDSHQDTTSTGAWQRHCDEETVITHKTKAVPPSNLQESLTLFEFSSHGIARQPAQRSPPHPKKMRILIIRVPVARHLSLHACPLTFASVPNQFDPLACRKPKMSVLLPGPSDTTILRGCTRLR